MQILVLGASGTDGSRLADPTRSWPALLRSRMPEVVGEEVEIVLRKYFIQGATLPQYLEKVLSEQKPDAVVLAISPFSFGVATVANRVGRLFGHRAGNSSRRTFNAIDRRTLRSKRKLIRTANGWLHAAARTTIGQEGEITEGEARRRYIATFERLAREEAMDVIVMGPVQHLGRMEKSQPKMNRQIARFSAALQEAASRKHFGWIDRQALVPLDLSPDVLLVDDVHGAELPHQLTVDALVAEFRRLVGRQPDSISQTTPARP